MKVKCSFYLFAVIIFVSVVTVHVLYILCFFGALLLLFELDEGHML